MISVVHARVPGVISLLAYIVDDLGTVNVEGLVEAQERSGHPIGFLVLRRGHPAALDAMVRNYAAQVAEGGPLSEFLADVAKEVGEPDPTVTGPPGILILDPQPPELSLN